VVHLPVNAQHVELLVVQIVGPLEHLAGDPAGRSADWIPPLPPRTRARGRKKVVHLPVAAFDVQFLVAQVVRSGSDPASDTHRRFADRIPTHRDPRRSYIVVVDEPVASDDEGLVIHRVTDLKSTGEALRQPTGISPQVR